MREICTRALRAAGYEITVAATPAEALLLSRETLGRFRLLITDVVMPGMDGLTLADELRRRHERLRVLFTSGHTADALADRGVIDSGLHFLAKPYTGTALLGKVRLVLDAT